MTKSRCTDIDRWSGFIIVMKSCIISLTVNQLAPCPCINPPGRPGAKPFAERKGDAMKFIKMSQYLKSAFVLAVLALMWGCGGGGGSTSNEVVSKVASVSVVPSSNSEYVIQGSNLVGVAAVELVVSYDSTTLSSPTVTNGGLFSDALFAANPNFTSSSIKIAIVSA